MSGRADLHRSARVTDRIEENARTVTLVLEASLACAPGQFAMLWLPGVGEKPYSIAGDDPLLFTVCRVGPFSESLAALRTGDRLWFRGPYGQGFATTAPAALLVGGGYGAAPLYFLARRLRRGGGVKVALGARTGAELLFPRRFEALGCEVRVATEDGSRGTRGLVTDVVRPLLAGGKVQRLFACGPEGMLEAVAGLCRQAGVPAELSHEALIRCGIGVCGSCGIGDRLVCIDGPVFAG